MKREIERRYNKLIADVRTNDYYKVDLSNRVNCYVCQSGHVTKMRDVDAGVTPMFYTCETCNLRASSTGYRDIAPDMQPTQEWYRPDLKKVLKLKGPMLEHVLSGGLMIRKIVESND
jgi:hypothetical protein